MASKYSKTHQPCDDCGSSDARSIYQDGSSHCFSCKTTTPAEEQSSVSCSTFLEGISIDMHESRGISQKVSDFFDYQRGMYQGQPCHIANIKDRGGKRIAQQVRMADKQFRVVGKKTTGLGLSGTHLWEPNKNVFVTIVEGYIDQMSVAEACGTQYPVVTIPMGVTSAEEAIKKDLDWLRGFKHVVLALDNDGPGKEAMEKVLKLFDLGQVKIATWTRKDANEMLLAGERNEIKSVLFNATTRRPDGIEDFGEIKLESIQELVNVGADTPFPKLNQCIRGLKKKHLYTIAAREKSGKTTLTKMMALKLIEQGHKVGLLYLEESADEARVSTYALLQGVPMWKVVENLDCLGGAESIAKGLEQLKGKGLYIYNHKGEFSADVLLERMHYMVVALGCEYIVLDNLSIAIAQDIASANERKMIDKLVTSCVSLIQNTGATILNVVHLRKNRTDKDGNDVETVTRADIHGSGAFAKFSHAIIGLERDSSSDRATLKVLANRDAGYEGYCDTLQYNPETGRLDLHIPTAIE